MSRRKQPKSAATPAQTSAQRIAKSSGAESATAITVAATPHGPRRISATAKELQDAMDSTMQVRKRNVTAGHASVGSMTWVKDGEIVDDPGMMAKLRLAKQIHGGTFKQANTFDGYTPGGGFADIGDSGNISPYNFEFPVDALEQPQSHRQELRYFRLAYERDPIVGRGIDMHVELTLAKMTLDKPKCSVQSFADYIYDWYQGWAQDISLFDVLLHLAREYWLSGEGFPYVEHKIEGGKSLNDTFPICEIAKKKARRGQTRTAPSGSDMNPTMNNDEGAFQWHGPKRSSLQVKWDRHKNANIYGFFDDESGELLVDPEQELRRVNAEARHTQGELERVLRSAALGKSKTAAVRKKADDPPAPEPLMKGPLQNLKEQRDQSMNPDAGGEDAPEGEGGDIGLESGDIGADAPMDLGGGLGGGGGMGGGLGGDPFADPAGGQEDPHTQNLKRYLKLLEKKKKALEELITLKEEKALEKELFSHVINRDYMGPDAINLLPPEVVEIKRDQRFNSAPVIHYKPSAAQKEAYLTDPKITPEDKQILETEGLIPLNDDPQDGSSYVLHFARKKALFEDHGRSVLQRCMRTIIYREKLRQVQVTLISRNMTPKTLLVAPDVSVAELDALRVHVDEAKADPDYTIVVNYEVTWNEIGAEGRLLSMESDWDRSSSELAIGLGFTPELLAGEGFYSGDRIRIEMLNTTYVHFRETLAEMVEQKILKPIAMRKGFYEIDAYGNPRWLYPKLNFSRLALRDSGDVYDMLYNLYIRNSVPVDIIYEFMNLDPETCRRKLEEDLFTVKDAKLNQALDSIYGSIVDQLLRGTDVVERVAKGLTLAHRDLDEMENAEGSGEGM